MRPIVFLSLLALAGAAARADIALAGVDFGASDVTHWTNTSSLGTIDNLIDDAGNPTALSVTLTQTNNTLRILSVDLGSPIAVNAGTLPISTPSLSGLQDNLFWLNSFTAAFSNLVPGGTYAVYAFGLRADGAPDQTVTITSAAGNIVFAQDFGGSGYLNVNGALGSSSEPLSDYADYAVADSNGDISITFTGSSSDFFTAGGVAISSDPEITATPEPASATYIILTVLAAAPFALRKRTRSE
jgi:hypothetical protein